MNNYKSFIESRSQLGGEYGFTPVWMPDFLYDFQADLVTWALEKGRAAIFADCGLGKTPMQLVWGENVIRKTNGNVLNITPLAVTTQAKREADKFGIQATVSRDGQVHKGITITNYQKLHYFNPKDFTGVICDESSILKNFDGATKTAITGFMRKIPYRLLATATAAPNDFTELGTSSEALGYLGYMDMLNKFFRNTLNNSATGRYRGETVKWRLKGHAETPFWQWVCSWARAIRKPSDIGYDDTRFILPPLIENQHQVDCLTLPEGWLFAVPAVGLHEQRQERRRTVQERCERVAELVNNTGKPALVWCGLNDEGDLLEKLIPDATQVAGRHSDDEKERKLTGFADGESRVLITKPKIGAWGLNYQHCSHVTFFPSHSFEQYYQGVRRCWRFGQKLPVTVDIVTSEGEKDVLNNMQYKANQADIMFQSLIAEMNDSMHLSGHINYTKNVEVPSWLA